GPAWLCLAFAVAIVVSYLPYLVFDDWWYIRFDLPAIPLILTLTVVALAELFTRVMPRASVPSVLAVGAVLAIWYAREPRARLAFEERDLEHHFVDAGTFVADRLPDRAAVVTAKYSGSVFYHARRKAVDWGVLPVRSLDEAFALLRDRGYEP